MEKLILKTRTILYIKLPSFDSIFYCRAAKLVVNLKKAANGMLENFAWDFFSKTGSIDGYLLYKQSMNCKEHSGDYGAYQNERRGYQTDENKG